MPQFNENDRPSKGFVQRLKERGIANKQIDLDTTIEDKDTWAAWEHWDNLNVRLPPSTLHLRPPPSVLNCCRL